MKLKIMSYNIAGGRSFEFGPDYRPIIHGELKERYPSDKMILFQQNIEEFATLAVDLLLSVLRGSSPAEQRLSYRFIPVS